MGALIHLSPLCARVGGRSSPGGGGDRFTEDVRRVRHSGPEPRALLHVLREPAHMTGPLPSLTRATFSLVSRPERMRGNVEETTR